LIELDDLGFDRGREAPGQAVDLDQTLCVDLHLGAGEDHPGSQGGFRRQSFVVQAHVAFESDPIDDRVLNHHDHQGVAFPAQGDVAEEPGGEDRLQGGIDLDRIKALAGVDAHIGAHRFRLDPLGPLDSDLLDGAAGLNRLGQARLEEHTQQAAGQDKR
jgi:hypothetical protein